MIIQDKEKENYHIVICDDNAVQLEQMRCICRDSMQLQEGQITTYSSGTMLCEAIDAGICHRQMERVVVFLDIELEGKDGVVLGQKLHEAAPDCVLIFITAHPEYAIRGYAARAFRYLLKPLTKSAVQDVMEAIDREYAGYHHALLNLPGMKQPVRLEDIVYISAEDKYAVIYTIRDSITIRASLGELENMLCTYGFFRVHRKYIVNMRYHHEISRGKLTLSNGESLPVSRRRENLYREKLLDKMERKLND